VNDAVRLDSEAYDATGCGLLDRAQSRTNRFGVEVRRPFERARETAIVS